MGQNMLITGGSGYFGCLLRDRLVDRGDSVRIFDLNDSEDRPSSVDFVAGDVRDGEAIRSACEGMDVVFHNVAQVPLAKDKDLFWTVNCDGTRRLLEAALDAGIRKVVHTSSSAIYGIPPSNPVDLRTEPSPGEAYGEAKLEGEKIVSEFAQQRGLDATIIRPRTILGHGRLGIFQILFDWLEQGSNIPVLGPGDNLYQFVHADDLADACIRASDRPGPASYLVGAETFGTMRETLEALCQHAGTGSRVKSVPMAPAVMVMNLTSALGLSPLGPYHALMYGRSLYFDVERTREDLGWRSRWSNIDMICESYDWYRAHKNKLGSGGSPHRSAVSQGILRWVRHLI